MVGMPWISLRQIRLLGYLPGRILCIARQAVVLGIAELTDPCTPPFDQPDAPVLDTSASLYTPLRPRCHKRGNRPADYSETTAYKRGRNVHIAKSTARKDLVYRFFVDKDKANAFRDKKIGEGYDAITIQASLKEA